MLFNSFQYVLFLPGIFLLYWLIGSNRIKYQNILLLTASYYFYSCWDFRFLFLLIFSTLLDYFTGIKIASARNDYFKKFWLWLSVLINVGFLAVFKYYNFFIASFSDLLSLFNVKTNFYSLSVILPVGISFYTFHGLSYVLDIYNKKIKPETNFIDYSLFVSFFPLLVAGPIERATHLLPQIKTKRHFDYVKAIDGLRQILWGLFKKLVIADNCAEYVNTVFSNYTDYTGSTLFVAAAFFALQIYGDFSGYSDIALGSARLFGIDLLKNFSFPYFSRDIAEFWRRWHISLSSWFRDYLYIPLGGNRGSILKKIRNVFAIFLVSGFWHGANWTFIVWGALNAIYIIPSVLFNTNRNNIEIVAKGKLFPSLKDVFSIAITFTLTVFAWIFFRSQDIFFAVDYLLKIFTFSSFSFPQYFPASTFALVIFFFVVEWMGRENNYALEKFAFKAPRFLRLSFYMLLIFLMSMFAVTGETPFIYFQF